MDNQPQRAASFLQHSSFMHLDILICFKFFLLKLNMLNIRDVTELSQIRPSETDSVAELVIC